jgi:hypothetical protein
MLSSPLFSGYSPNLNAIRFESKKNLSESKRQNISFEGDKPQYENPVSRKMEKFLAAMGTLAFSVIPGAIATFLTYEFKQNKKLAAIAGLTTTAITALLTMPGALYNANVQAFAKEKEADVFSRTKSVETKLSEGIDQNITNNTKSFEENINDYVRFTIGHNGRGSGLFINA